MLLLCLTGCRYEEPEEVVRAKQAQYNAKELYTDHASIIFAQQELDLARSKAAAGAPEDAAEKAAVLHQQLAAMQLQLDTDNSNFERDLKKIKSFSEQIQASRPQEVSR